MTYQNHVPAAERTLLILESVVASHNGITAAQLSEILSIPRSAVYALLNTLMRLGYIVQEGPRKPYLPGPRLWYLNRPYPSGTDALVTAFQAETGRSKSTEETYALAILSGQEIVILAETPAQHRVRCVIPAGYRENATSHPAGLVLLAGLSQFDESQRLILFTDTLADKLEYTRRTTVIVATAADVITLAAPICPDGHHPEAALILCCPTFRWTPHRGQLLSTEVHDTAARISHRLGASIYQPYERSGIHPTRESVKMTHDDLATFLDGPWAARLACVRADGTPHVVPVWYEWQHNAFIIVAWPNSVWADLVMANPNVALSIDEPWPPMRRVMVRGKAKHIPQDEIPGGITNLRQRISTRYLGTRTPAEELTPNSGIWSVFRVTPYHTISLIQKPPGD